MTSERFEAHPTRLELLALRRRRRLAEGIADILQKDLETLILALIEERKKAKMLQTKLYESMEDVYSLVVKAKMASGTLKVREISMSAAPVEYNIETTTRTGVLGIQFPSFQLTTKIGITKKPRFNPSDTPIQLEDAATKAEEAVSSMVRLAELTAVIRELLEVIALKRRQINRIRFKIIPQLDDTIRYVELILEEIERQDAIRVRVLQRKRKERVS